MPKQIFLQSELLADVELIEIDEHANAAALRIECLKRVSKDGVEIEDLLFYLEDDDSDDPVRDLDQVPHGLRVHLHRLKAIDVTVRYAGRDIHRTFRPSSTVKRVKQWAAHEFAISASDAAELMLQVTGTDVRPDLDTHIGALVKSPERAIAFDLVPAPRVNG
jgi:hypothetical protein